MIKLFTHTDLDGIGCAILAKYTFKRAVDISYCDLNDIDEKVEKYICQRGNVSDCFITDIRISEKLVKEIDNKFDNFCLLDHHQTALYLNEYDWCKVKIENETTHIKTSGTEMYYKWLVENNILNKSDVLDRFVALIRDYDTWRWAELGEAGLICKQVNDLLYLYGRDNFINWCLDEIKDGVFPTLRPTESLLLRVRQREIDEYIEKKDNEIIFSELCGSKCGFVFAENYVSELGNKLCTLHPEIDFIVMIDLGNRTVSYRTTKDDVNLGKDIAPLYGGGGHPKAAGSQFSQEIGLKIIKSIFGGK